MNEKPKILKGRHLIFYLYGYYSMLACKVLCKESSSFWAEFVNKNRCISVRIQGGEKHLINNFENSHNNSHNDQNISFIIFVKTDSMSGCDIRLVFTFLPKDNTLQYKKMRIPLK